VLLAGAVLLAVLLAGGSSRAMLASARLSCFRLAWNLCFSSASTTADDCDADTESDSGVGANGYW